MMRLAVAGLDEADLRDLASRLRGSSVVAYGRGADGPPACETFDAAALTTSSVLGIVAQSEQLLLAGRHVMLTAPTSLSHETLARLTAAARQSGARLAVMNPDRFLPSRRLVKQQLEAGKLGEVGLLRLHRWESTPVKNDDASLAIASAAWRDLELAMWLVDRQPNVVYAVGCKGIVDRGENAGARSSGQFVQLHLGFPGGAMALIDYCDGLPPGDGYCSLGVIGSAGAAYADDHQNMQLLYQGGRPIAVRAGEGIHGLTAMLQGFVDSLRSDRDMSADLATWRSVGAVADAAVRSVTLRRAVQPEMV